MSTSRKPGLLAVTFPYKIDLEVLVDGLAGQKNAFLKEVHEKVFQKVSRTSRTEIVSIVEEDGFGEGRDRTHRPGIDSYVKVFSCFVAKKRFHGHKLDSAISVPVAMTVSECYSGFMVERQVEIAEFFMKKIIEDQVLRSSILGHAADELLKRGVKQGRGQIISLLAHSLTAHATHTHVGLAIQHGVLIATSHLRGVAAGTTAIIGAALLASLILKAVATHMGLTMAEVLHTQALHGLAAVLAKKAGLAACAGLTVSFLSTHLGSAGAATIAHAVVAPLAAGAVAMIIYRLPKSLGKKVAKGIQDELSGEFKSMTRQVLNDLVKDILSIEALGKAIAGEIVAMENWQGIFEANIDTSAFPGLNSDVAADIGSLNDIREGFFGEEEQLLAPNPDPSQEACPICDASLCGVRDSAREEHILKCSRSSVILLQLTPERSRPQTSCPICKTSMDGKTEVARNKHVLDCSSPAGFAAPMPIPPTLRPLTVTAMHTFSSSVIGDLVFEKGQVITVLKRSDCDWWTGKIGEKVGIFPINYVKMDEM